MQRDIVGHLDRAIEALNRAISSLQPSDPIIHNTQLFGAHDTLVTQRNAIRRWLGTPDPDSKPMVTR